MPASTSSWQSCSYSSAEPSHQWISSGSVRAAISSTQASRRSFLVGAGAVVFIDCKRLLRVAVICGARPARARPAPDRIAGERKNAHRGAMAKAYRTPDAEAFGFSTARPAVPRPRRGGPAACWRPRRVPARHEHEPLELGHEHAVLVEDARVHLHGAAVGLGLRLLLLEHLGLAEERVAVEHRRRMLELFGGEVGDRLAADVAHRHAERQRVDERAHDDVAALLGGGRVDVVDVQRVVVHGDQAEEVVVGLGDGLGRPVLVHVADLELLQVAAVGVGAARLARGLIGLQCSPIGLGCGLTGLDGSRVAHWPLEVSFDWCSPRQL